MKVALITGASGKIGGETVKKFAKNGYFVFAHINANRGGIDNVIKELLAEGIKDTVFAVQADFSDEKSIQNMFDTIKKSFSHVDVLVNNAGVGLYKMITETHINEWRKVFDINVTSTYFLTNLVLEKMIERKSGKIINVSSIWGKDGASMEVCYSASKSALIGYTKALAKELAPSNVNVNCICPGVIDTAMNKRFSPEEIEELKNATPLGRLGKASEVADLIYYLSTDSASFITGQIITVDGGFTL